jgi:hypothetical protein
MAKGALFAAAREGEVAGLVDERRALRQELRELRDGRAGAMNGSAMARAIWNR